MFRFEKFDVWHRAVDFAELVYEVTRAFPVDERFGLTSQMRRAAVSISSNVAEGSSRTTDREFARFVEIAYGSLMEVISQANLATRQGYLRQEQLDQLQQDGEQLARMLSGLQSTLKK